MTITVTPTVEAGNVPPRVRLDVAASAGETLTTVTRINGDGSSTPVRTGDGNPLPISGGVALVYDYEMGYGDAVAYTSVESPGTVSAQVTVAAAQAWLVHPGVPALSIPVTFRPGTLQEETYTVSQAAYVVMGRPNPVVVNDGIRHGAASILIVTVASPGDLQAVKDLLWDAATLLLNIPLDLATEFDTCYVAIGEVKIGRWTDVVIDGNRDISLPFQVVDRPIGGSQSQRTYVDVLTGYSSYAAVLAAYPSYTALLAGP